MNTPRAIHTVGFAALVLMVGSCGGKDVTGPPAVAAVQVTASLDTLTAIGATRDFAAVAKDAGGNTLPAETIRWRSSAPGVISIDSVTGVATAVANGTALLSASVAGIQGQVSLTVAQAVGTVVLTPGNPSFATVGDTIRLTATAKDSLGTTVPGVKFLWVATNPSVATVDTAGLVTARGAGTGSISAAGRGVPGSAPVLVVQAAHHLAFIVQPMSTGAARALSPAIQVEVRDANDNRVSSSSAAITMDIGANPVGGSLAGTTTVNATSGVATFSGLAIAKAATGYTLAASASGVTGATSAGFDISPGVAAQLAFTRQPPARVEGNMMIDSVVVAVRDSFGNAVPSGSVTLGIATAQWPGATMSGTATHAVSAGTAAWVGAVSIDKPGTYTLGATLGSLGAASAPFRVGLTFQQLTVGELHACGITTGGTYCWGYNIGGVMGQPGTFFGDSTPVLVSGGLTFTQITAGAAHMCGLVASGQAYCWGRSLQGQVGDSTNNIRTTPTPVAGGHLFTSIAAGYNATCAIATDTFTYCWGANNTGQLGTGTLDRNVPTVVAGGITFTAVAVGLQHSCGLTAAGVAYCWGDNSYGELGDSTYDSSPVPVAVKTSLSFTTIAAGGGAAGDASCAISVSPANYTWCWGSNGVDQLGNLVDGGADSWAPKNGVQVAGTRVKMFGQFGCSSNSVIVSCWGDNPHGELGDDYQLKDTPRQIGSNLYLDQFAVGMHSGCARRVGDGVVFCWGHNDYGQVGDGTTQNDRHGPVLIVQ